MSAPAVRLGAAIQKARFLSGLTQAEAAEAAGLSAQYLCDIEAARRLPPRETRERLAEAIGVSADALHALAGELPGVAYQCASHGLQTIEDAEAFADLVNAALKHLQEGTRP